MIEPSETAAINQIAERLTYNHPAVPPTTVSDVVRNIHATFDGNPVRDFIPLLVERHAKNELGQLSD